MGRLFLVHTPSHTAVRGLTVTLELHQQPLMQQRAHRLERRAAAMQLLVPPKVRRHKRPWMREGIASMAAIFRVAPDQQLHPGCEPHQGLINDRPHLGLLTRRRAHRRPPTGHALTSPRLFEHFAAGAMTSA